MEIRLIDANKLFEEVGHIKPENLKHYDHLGNFMEMITNSPTIKPPRGYKPIEDGWWMYFGLPEHVERVTFCKDCHYGCSKEDGRIVCGITDYEVEEWGYCYMASRSYETDETD